MKSCRCSVCHQQLQQSHWCLAIPVVSKTIKLQKRQKVSSLHWGYISHIKYLIKLWDQNLQFYTATHYCIIHLTYSWAKYISAVEKLLFFNSISVEIRRYTEIHNINHSDWLTHSQTVQVKLWDSVRLRAILERLKPSTLPAFTACVHGWWTRVYNEGCFRRRLQIL